MWLDGDHDGFRRGGCSSASHQRPHRKELQRLERGDLHLLMADCPRHSCWPFLLEFSRIRHVTDSVPVGCDKFELYEQSMNVVDRPADLEMSTSEADSVR